MKSIRHTWLLFALCMAAFASVVSAHDEETNVCMYDLFWTIFWLGVLGFLIYLLCTYPVMDWTTSSKGRSRSQASEPVINVRIINPLPLHNDG